MNGRAARFIRRFRRDFPEDTISYRCLKGHYTDLSHIRKAQFQQYVEHLRQEKAKEATEARAHEAIARGYRRAEA